MQIKAPFPQGGLLRGRETLSCLPLVFLALASRPPKCLARVSVCFSHPPPFFKQRLLCGKTEYVPHQGSFVERLSNYNHTKSPLLGKGGTKGGIDSEDKWTINQHISVANRVKWKRKLVKQKQYIMLYIVIRLSLSSAYLKKRSNYQSPTAYRRSPLSTKGPYFYLY